MNRKSGKYIVPPEILALAPKDIPCQIEVQHYHSVKRYAEGEQNRTYYYVYENRAKSAKLLNDNTKPHGRMLLGKIIDNKFIPNAKGLIRMEEIRVALGLAEAKPPVEDEPPLPSVRPYLPLPRSMDLEIKNYGEFTLVLSCTEDIFQTLAKGLAEEDALYTYVLGILCFVGGNKTYTCFAELFSQSILSIRWPELSLTSTAILSSLTKIGQYEAKLEECKALLLSPGSELSESWNQLEKNLGKMQSHGPRSIFRESLPPLDINQYRGLKFLSLVTFLIENAFQEQLQKADPNLITLPSQDVLLMQLSSLKIARHRDRKLRIARPTLDLLYIFYIFGINIDEDMNSLQYDFMP